MDQRNGTVLGYGHTTRAWLALAMASGLAAAAAGCASDGDEGTEGKGHVITPGSGGSGGLPTGNAGNGGTVDDMMSGVAGMAMGNAGGGPSTGSGGSGAVGTGSGKPLPCAVNKIVAKNCGSCHSNPTMWSAPMPLVTADDFQRDYTVQQYTKLKGQTMKMHALVKARINDAASPMPPGGGMAATDLTALNTWLDSGAPAGTDADKTCDAQPIDMNGSDDPLCAPQAGEQETCYEFPVHGGQTPDDRSKYSVATGEHYEQFYYKVPWGSDVQATRFGAKYDNTAVLHHWLLYTTNAGLDADGTHQTVIGTTIGEESQLLAGWAVGGRDVCFPKHIGLQLPPPGGMLDVQWHFYNSGNAAADDATSVFICTVPAGTRPNTAGLTWLGTENLSMQPGQMADKTGSCPNDSGADIHVWAFWPHMHKLGRHMKSTVTHADTGMTETVFDKAFDFNHQVHYPFDTELVLKPNDVVTSTCTFDNVTDGVVDYGPSSNEEMCYQFAFSYPAGALDNGVFSLTGASNTCWMFGE
jgi:hypothetical protein